jgi:hypothetical protein
MKWKREVRKLDPTKDLLHPQRSALRLLLKDKVFVLATEKLKSTLERVYPSNQQAVERFFHRFGSPNQARLERIRKYIAGISDERIRKALEQYVRYALRFPVVMVIKKKSPHFRVLGAVPYGPKFYAQMRNGHLKPRVSIPDETEGPSSPELFESNDLKLPDPIQQQIDKDNAAFFQIKDKSGSSVLNEIERLSYRIDGVTFIRHDAEQPYLFCLIGEAATKMQLRSAEKAITDFQKAFDGRGKAGRGRDLRRVRRNAKRLSKPHIVKNLAMDDSTKTGVKSWSSADYLQRLKRTLSK